MTRYIFAKIIKSFRLHAIPRSLRLYFSTRTLIKAMQSEEFQRANRLRLDTHKRFLISHWNLTVSQKPFPASASFFTFSHIARFYLYDIIIIRNIFFAVVFAPFEFIAHARFLLCQINKPIARKYKTGAHKINRTRSSNTILRNCIMPRLINNGGALAGFTFKFIDFWHFLWAKVRCYW